MFYIRPIRDCGGMHYLTSFVNREGDIRSSNGKILKCPNNASIESGIIEFCRVSKFRKRTRIRRRFALVHMGFLKNK